MPPGEGCEGCPAARGSLLVLDYASMPDAFFPGSTGGGGGGGGGRPGFASVAELFGAAPLSAQTTARARYISQYFSKSMFDKPHAFALRGGAGGGSGGGAGKRAPKRPVPPWMREIVRQEMGATLRQLRPFLT